MSEPLAGGVLLARELGFTEGPVRLTDGRIMFTSINGTLYALDGEEVAPAIATGCGATGLAADRAGSVFVAACSGLFGAPAERPAGIHHLRDGTLEPLVTESLLAPNDICFGPEGLLYFTDPTDDPKALFEAPVRGRVCRCDPDTGQLLVLDEGGLFPNGLAFDATGERLYVSESYARRIVCYRLTDDGLTDKRVIVDSLDGPPDGMALDVDGNIWQCVNPADAIEIFSPEGRRLDRLPTGDGSYPSNCCFGGPDMRTLFVTVAGVGGIATFEVGTRGLQLYPFR